ncbi:ATP synthase complex subunit h domain containing protein [Amanita muscaria]
MSTLLRQATSAARQASRVRNFSSSSVSRKGNVTQPKTNGLPNIPADIIQDLYLREIKAYKPAAIAKDAHVGVVKSYSLPPAPKPPVLPTDLASELAAYESSEPTLASRAAAQETSGEGESGAEEFLAFLEQDLPKPEAHH